MAGAQEQRLDGRGQQPQGAAVPQETIVVPGNPAPPAATMTGRVPSRSGHAEDEAAPPGGLTRMETCSAMLPGSSQKERTLRQRRRKLSSRRTAPLLRAMAEAEAVAVTEASAIMPVRVVPHDAGGDGGSSSSSSSSSSAAAALSS